MLRTRIITALILAPTLIAAIYLLATPWLSGLLWMVGAAGAWEWAALAGLSSRASRAAYVGVLTVLAVLLYANPDLQLIWLQSLVVFWVAALVVVLAYPGSSDWAVNGWTIGLAGALVLPGAVLALMTIHGLPNGANWLLFSLLICWAADIGAYFAGRRFGRRKLAAAVSPGKTWEGAIGGLLFALIVCAGLLFAADQFSVVWMLVLVGLVGVSILGDLFESLLKRVSGIKDSGQLLPGHGGVLDRVDSILSVAPCFALWMLQYA
jgi:phosphatidate cytidylyltransferase